MKRTSSWTGTACRSMSARFTITLVGSRFARVVADRPSDYSLPPRCTARSPRFSELFAVLPGTSRGCAHHAVRRARHGKRAPKPGSPPCAERMQARLAILPFWDRFEDFYDRLGVSLEDYAHLTGDWLFNYIGALGCAGIESSVYFASARVTKTVRFRHVS